MMKLSMRYIILYVNDVHESKRFYADLLGLPIRGEHGLYIEFDTGSTILAINTRDSVRELIALPIPNSRLEQNTFEIGFVVEDVNETINELRSSDVPILIEPTQKPWGQTVAYVADPDGNFVELCTSMG